jgi:hypothetical protein
MYYDYPEPFNGAENNFQFSAAFLSIKPFRFKANDPRIAQINARTVVQTQADDGIIFTKYPTTVYPCDPEVDFSKDSRINAFKQNLTKFTCVDSSQINF